ncbi:hypothetical protein JW613_07890 [Streptomyces smyrnaeus]|uniref:Nucleopolyhedrovirus P10 family protein n=1 Tax=Streptomyces smyrnaeus TaxID=1387713 RepID=A0ABS3XS50_9ACTN|nr:hypothetical protein [Streptomyces smyrnaeus]MBO8198225.1 hypothetical protein [Streptomyces smyrnaeus]
MTAERLTQVVRQQLGMGRLLPLGEAADGAWVTEEAALDVLRRAVPDTRLSAMRVELSGPGTGTEPAVPPPPSALPPGPLTLTAELAVPADRPVPAAADEVRRALLATAERELGLALESVDLRVTELVDAPGDMAAPAPGPGHPPVAGQGPESEATGAAGTAEAAGTAGAAHQEAADRVRRAVLAVDGVARLAPVVGPALSRVAAGPAISPVRIEGDPEAGRCHVLLQLGVSPTRRVLATARAAGAAARGVLGAADQVTVAVLVTAVDRV